MELSKLADIFKALSNEQRLKIFQMVALCNKNKSQENSKECCCQGVEKTFTKACKCLKISKSTISHHIKELQNANLIKCNKKGQMTICFLNSEIIEQIKAFFKL